MAVTQMAVTQMAVTQMAVTQMAGKTQLAVWRAQLFEGAAIWSGRGRHEMDDGRGLALSGVASADGNVIFCFGGDLPGALRRSARDALQSAVPVVIMAGADALGWVQVLVDSGLVCVGVAPVMHLPASRIEAGVVEPGMRALGLADLDEARAVVADAYAKGSPMADIAFPDEAVGSANWGLWGLEMDGALVSVVTTSRVGDAVCIWSMSTPAHRQHRGHGRRLLCAVLSEMAAAGIDHVLLYASPSGAPLYRAMGFDVVDHWQQWSRPRWILGRT